MKKISYAILLILLFSCETRVVEEIDDYEKRSQISAKPSDPVLDEPVFAVPSVSMRESLICGSPSSVPNVIDNSLPTVAILTWFDYAGISAPPYIRAGVTFDFVRFKLAEYYNIDISDIIYNRDEGYGSEYSGEKYIFMRESDYNTNGSIGYLVSPDEGTIFLQQMIKHINSKRTTTKIVSKIYFDHVSYLCVNNLNYSGVSVNAKYRNIKL